MYMCMTLYSIITALPGGAIAGIVVGVLVSFLVAFIIVVGLIACFVKRRKGNG